MGEKKSFVLFNDLSVPVKALSNEDAGQLFKAIFEYQNGGIEQELTPSVEIAFIFVKQQLDRNQEKYEAICERNRINGAKGGRPKEPKEPSGLSGNPTKPKKPDTDIDPDPDNDNEIKEKNEPFLYLAELLYELHKKEDIKYHKPLSHRHTWANDIRLLNNDGRSKEEIESVIRWCQEPGCFWFPNIISGKKLRAKFDTMLFQMKRDENNNTVDKKQEEIDKKVTASMEARFARQRARGIT